VNLNENERLLLMSAALLGLGPDADIRRANTYKVVRQVVLWSGGDEDELFREWCQGAASPRLDEFDQIYDALIRMVRCDGPAKSLFEGGGSWGSPDGDPACAPQFNSCRLTALGEQEARRLLEQHPQYRNAAPASGRRQS
jgi:hypothetical protein